MKTTYPLLLVVLLAGAATAGPPPLDERPAGPGEWGFRPRPDAVSRRNPPSFAWRPQRGSSSSEQNLRKRWVEGEKRSSPFPSVPIHNEPWWSSAIVSIGVVKGIASSS